MSTPNPIAAPRSTWLRRHVLAVIPAAAALFALFAGGAHADRAGDRWTGTWSAAMQTPLAPPATFDHVTLRQIVHVSLAGRAVRVRFSNAQGTAPLVIGGASIGVRASGASVRPRSLRPLTFAGAASISVAPGGVALTDPVALDVDAFDDLAISLYVPAPQVGTTQLTLAHQTSYVSPAGDFTRAADMAIASTITSWYWLSGVEVIADRGARAVVTFGDSITEGFASTTDANARWPDVLARRLHAQRRTADVGVLNTAISGNRLLNDVIGPNAQRRIDRDVLTQAGLGYVILLIGTNDMGFSQLAPGRSAPVCRSPTSARPRSSPATSRSSAGCTRPAPGSMAPPCCRSRARTTTTPPSSPSARRSTGSSGPAAGSMA